MPFWQIFNKITIEVNFDGGGANLTNPQNFSGNFPDSSDFSEVICQILQIPRGSGNSKPKFQDKKLVKVCSQKFLLSTGVPLAVLRNFFRGKSFWTLIVEAYLERFVR